jgi:nuclear transport factor 2 (NTF2) superfamily protein
MEQPSADRAVVPPCAANLGHLPPRLDEFFRGCEQIVAFLRRKWSKELDYALRKEL